MLLFAGCSALRGDAPKADDKVANALAAHAPPARFRLEVDAPRDLKKLLAENLDLARFRNVPPSEGLNSQELDRLIAAAPEQARRLLATEGYFDADVRVTREPPEAPGQLAAVVVHAAPGPRTLVDEAKLAVQGDLRQRADAGDASARALIDRLQREWRLQPGEPFRQAEWSSAKTATLASMHAEGYPTASWLTTEAAVRRRDQRVELELVAQSGPLFHFGELHIEGLQRYDDASVRNLTTFEPGTPYSEKRLFDFQERLQRSGLFKGAVVEIAPDPQQAAAAPVTVRVQEEPLQKVVLGLGYDTDTGARASIEHTHRRPFGLHWTAQDNLTLGPRRKAWDFDFRSHPKGNFERNLVGGNIERWSGPDEERYAGQLRVGHAWEDPRLQRQAYVQFDTARVRTPVAQVRNAQSLSANLDWTRRDVDSLLLPTRGKALVFQGAMGYARSISAENGPFGRLYARLHYFHPFATHWHARLRVEAGDVIARHQVGVPETLLFRAGGEDSVRGYAYRSLGPVVNGVITSGRVLFTASAEAQRPVSTRFPQIWGAAFIDAGNAAQSFGTLRPKVGVGAGVRYRSPVGPLRLDLAYGVNDRRFRLHLSAGVNF